MHSEWNLGGRGALLAAALCVAGGLAATPSVVSAQADNGSSDSSTSSGATDASAANTAASDVDGAALFKSKGCGGCHGEDGGGGMGPKVAGDPNLSDAAFVAHRIVYGGGNMPAFGKTLKPEEIAALGSYVRNSWGNQFGDVSVDEVNKEIAAGRDGGETKPKVLEPAE